MPIVRDWLLCESPDLVAFQETKVEDDKFPRAEFEELGYEVAIHGQKSYNGVAIISKKPLDEVTTGLEVEEFSQDCRVLKCFYQGIRFIGTYVPNGTALDSPKFEYKLQWLRVLRDLLQVELRAGHPVIWMGDINVAPQDIDVYEPERKAKSVCFTQLEKDALKACLDLGLTDCFRKYEKGSGHYSYWEFFVPNSFKRNLGWRIDHIYASEHLADQCQSCWIDKRPREQERPSDHTPVLALFSI